MSNNEQQIEQEIQDKGLNAPRLTPGLIDSKIVLEMYFTGAGIINAQTLSHHLGLVRVQHHDGDELHKPMETLTFCVLVLENGFTVTGESACASPENFDAEIGRKIAFENARNKIWPLEGYLLKEKLHIKVGEHESSDIKFSQPVEDKKCEDGIKPFEPSCSSQACVDGRTSPDGHQLNVKRDNAFLVAQLLSNKIISAELRKKAETKMAALLDELI